MDFETWKQRFVGAFMALTDCDEGEAVELADQYSAEEVVDTCPVETAAACVDESAAGDEEAA